MKKPGLERLGAEPRPDAEDKPEHDNAPQDNIDNEEDDETMNDDKKKDDTKSENDKPKADDKPVTQPEATDRSVAVFASEESTGRERLAADCLASFPSASATEIVGFLGKQPVAQANDTDAPDAEKLLSKMAENADTDTGIEGGDPQAEENHGWAKIHDEIQAQRA